MVRVALAFGIRPRDVLGWSQAELELVRAYDQQEPIGPERNDTMHAQTAMLIYNTNAKPSGRRKLRDFMPFRRRHRATNELDQAIIDTLGDG